MQVFHVYVRAVRRGWQVQSSGDLRERFDTLQHATEFAQRFAEVMQRDGMAVQVHGVAPATVGAGSAPASANCENQIEPARAG